MAEEKQAKHNNVRSLLETVVERTQHQLPTTAVFYCASSNKRLMTFLSTVCESHHKEERPDGPVKKQKIEQLELSNF